MNIEHEVIFRDTDNKDSGFLTWNLLSIFTIYDSNMNEVDQFTVYNVNSVTKAVHEASKHFCEIAKEIEK